MKTYTLKYLDPANDVDFLNTTAIDFDFVDDDVDSGWRDVLTGSRILLSSDRIIFRPITEQDETLLRFKFGDRLVQL